MGEGFHYRAGLPHAEVFALRAAGDKARGATAYVTLEPCSHYGRTPPCALALIEAGISCVVCAMVDPNPKVAGNGVTLLQNAGVTVEVGLLEQDARALNLGFIKAMQTGMPYVQLKWHLALMVERLWLMVRVSGLQTTSSCRCSAISSSSRRYFINQCDRYC